MGIVISPSTKIIRSTMPELIALKLLALARRGLQTSPNINIQIEKNNLLTDIRMRIGLNQVQKLLGFIINTFFGINLL